MRPRLRDKLVESDNDNQRKQDLIKRHLSVLNFMLPGKPTAFEVIGEKIIVSVNNGECLLLTLSLNMRNHIPSVLADGPRDQVLASDDACIWGASIPKPLLIDEFKRGHLTCRKIRQMGSSPLCVCVEEPFSSTRSFNRRHVIVGKAVPAVREECARLTFVDMQEKKSVLSAALPSAVGSMVVSPFDPFITVIGFEGVIGLSDFRSANIVPCGRETIHRHLITSASFMSPNYFTTGDEAGIVAIWDMRVCKQPLQAFDAEGNQKTQQFDSLPQSGAVKGIKYQSNAGTTSLVRNMNSVLSVRAASDHIMVRHLRGVRHLKWEGGIYVEQKWYAPLTGEGILPITFRRRIQPVFDIQSAIINDADVWATCSDSNQLKFVDYERNRIIHSIGASSYANLFWCDPLQALVVLHDKSPIGSLLWPFG